MAKSKYKTYLITIEDIDGEGVSYGKWHFRSKYVVAKLTRLLKKYEGYEISIYSCSAKSVIYSGTFDSAAIDYMEDEYHG